MSEHTFYTVVAVLVILAMVTTTVAFATVAYDARRERRPFTMTVSYVLALASAVLSALAINVFFG